MSAATPPTVAIWPRDQLSGSHIGAAAAFPEAAAARNSAGKRPAALMRVPQAGHTTKDVTHTSQPREYTVSISSS